MEDLLYDKFLKETRPVYHPCRVPSVRLSKDHRNIVNLAFIPNIIFPFFRGNV
jgi:hypothetical protein